MDKYEFKNEENYVDDYADEERQPNSHKSYADKNY